MIKGGGVPVRDAPTIFCARCELPRPRGEMRPETDPESPYRGRLVCAGCHDGVPPMEREGPDELQIEPRPAR